MADFAGPSFSLGLDLDLDLDLSTEEEGNGGGEGLGGPPKVQPEGERSTFPGASSSECTHWSGEDEAEGGFCRRTPGEDPPDRTGPLKRLRRGTPRQPPPDLSTPRAAVRFSALDDDIEEFSSQEDCVVRDVLSSRQNQSSCSSSKFSLQGQRVLTTMSGKKSKAPKMLAASGVSIPTSVEASSNKRVFPRLTVSPLKRIQLLDSDSDDLSVNEDKLKIHGEQQGKAPESWESSWESFSPVKNFSLATPALDQYCEDYFKEAKARSVSRQQSEQQPSATASGLVLPHSCADETEDCPQLPDLHPPSYQYFFHPDIRIQKLVQQRLPNFTPLGDAKSTGSRQRNTEAALDYMGQFGQRRAASQIQGAEEPDKRGRPRNRKNGKGIKISGTSGSPSAIPKDAAKRRVSAVGSCGHWFTGQDGRKVYVTKNGQELSGQIAYRQYKKEIRGTRRAGKRAPGDSKKKPKR